MKLLDLLAFNRFPDDDSHIGLSMTAEHSKLLNDFDGKGFAFEFIQGRLVQRVFTPWSATSEARTNAAVVLFPSGKTVQMNVELVIAQFSGAVTDDSWLRFRVSPGDTWHIQGLRPAAINSTNTRFRIWGVK